MRYLWQVANCYTAIRQYEKKWDEELLRILQSADNSTSQSIQTKNKERRGVASSGVIVPLILNMIEVREEPKNADYLLSAFTLGVSFIDDVTEGVDKKLKQDMFANIEALLYWDKNVIPWTIQEIRSCAYLFEYVYNTIQDNKYKNEFINALRRLKDSAILDDSGLLNIEVRAEVWRSYGNITKVFIDSQVPVDFSRYQLFIESLFGGTTILDDMSDVFEDYQVKNTRPLAILKNQKPTMLNILCSGMISSTFTDAENEFQRGMKDIEHLPQAKIKYQQIISSFKLFYVLNLGNKYLKQMFHK